MAPEILLYLGHATGGDLLGEPRRLHVVALIVYSAACVVVPHADEVADVDRVRFCAYNNPLTPMSRVVAPRIDWFTVAHEREVATATAFVPVVHNTMNGVRPAFVLNAV